MEWSSKKNVVVGVLPQQTAVLGVDSPFFFCTRQLVSHKSCSKDEFKAFFFTILPGCSQSSMSDDNDDVKPDKKASVATGGGLADKEEKASKRSSTKEGHVKESLYDDWLVSEPQSHQGGVKKIEDRFKKMVVAWCTRRHTRPHSAHSSGEHRH